MSFPVNFYFTPNEQRASLRLNNTFIKYIKILNNICSALEPVSGKISIDGKEVDWDTGKYEYLAHINIDWIKSKFQVDDNFINWWKFCIEKQLIEFISKYVHIDCEDPYMSCFDITYNNGKYDIKLPVKLTNEEFYIKFLMFNGICPYCWLYSSKSGSGCSSWEEYCNRFHCEHKNTFLKSIYDQIYINNDYYITDNGLNELNDYVNEWNDKLSASQQATQAQLDKFEKFHRNEYAHMRTDFESCATLINKNTEKQKTYCDETNLLISDLQDRIVKMEFLLSGNVNYKLIDEAIEMPKKPIATTDMITTLEQTIADQKQMIDELRDELKKQHDEFEAYKLQKQRQLAAIMM